MLWAMRKRRSSSVSLSLRAREASCSKWQGHHQEIDVNKQFREGPRLRV